MNACNKKHWQTKREGKTKQREQGQKQREIAWTFMPRRNSVRRDRGARPQKSRSACVLQSRMSSLLTSGKYLYKLHKDSAFLPMGQISQHFHQIWVSSHDVRHGHIQEDGSACIQTHQNRDGVPQGAKETTSHSCLSTSTCTEIQLRAVGAQRHPVPALCILTHFTLRVVP